MKVLPSGVYQYRFIVDGQQRYSPDLPWEQDESGNGYNILDLQVPFVSLLTFICFDSPLFFMNMFTYFTIPDFHFKVKKRLGNCIFVTGSCFC